MKNDTKIFKAIVLTVALATGMLLPVDVWAQLYARNGGMLGRGSSTVEGGGYGLFTEQFGSSQGGYHIGTQLFGSSDGGYDIGTQQFGTTEGGYHIGTQQFGHDEELPLGSGLLVLVAAGAGYALLSSSDAVTIPAGCLYHTVSYQFTNEMVQMEYEMETSFNGDDSWFWRYHGNLVEGVDYIMNESFIEITSSNTNEVFGSATVTIL